VVCHVRPGVAGWVHDKAWAGTKDLAVYVFGTPVEAYNLKAKVDSQVCLSCHQHILRMSEVAPRDLPPPVKDVGLVMSHRKHMEAFGARNQGEGCTSYLAGMCLPTISHGIPSIRKALISAPERSTIASGAMTARANIRAESWTANVRRAIFPTRSKHSYLFEKRAVG
jgi:hypothetical protein